MPERGGAFERKILAMMFAGLLACTVCGSAQSIPVERTFRASKSTVEKALKELQPAMSGHLPAIEGFAVASEHPLTKYKRAFYQCTAQVTATPSGGSVVRVSAKVTAWYADENSSRSGYQLLTSNGRIEADLLDQLADQLSSVSNHAEEGAAPTSPPTTTPKQRATDEPVISAPMPRRGAGGGFSTSPSSPTGTGLTVPSSASQQPTDAKAAQKENAIQSETASLEEVLKNQAHPNNLVIVKKSGTAVVASPSLSGKTLFMASMHDEFEMLDLNADWVHVRISGLSRGWIWRSSLQMPEGIPDVARPVATAPPTAADLFRVSREETAPFPGDWEPLRGKNVKIISVQKIRENEQEGGARAKLEFAKSLLDRNYEQLAQSPDLSGLVLIFDSVDGGMVAATSPTIQRWKAGKLTDAALWHQCYFDPPETFTVSTAAGSH